MKPRIWLCWIVLLEIVSFQGEIRANDFLKKFSLKFTGGTSWAGWGDLQAYAGGANTRYADQADAYDFTKTGRLALPRADLDAAGEAILSLPKKIGLGIGVGYISGTRDSRIEISLPSAAGSATAWQMRMSAMPVTANAYYQAPISGRLGGYLKAGLAYYPIKINLTARDETEVLGIVQWSRSVAVARDHGLGFHAGLGLEYRIFRYISGVVEGTWRWAKSTDWTAEQEVTSNLAPDRQDSGSLWYAEELNGATGQYYPVAMISGAQPAGPGIRNVRKAEIDLTGWAIQAGLRIRFGR
jgi:opacity protein-like surface antigen